MEWSSDITRFDLSTKGKQLVFDLIEYIEQKGYKVVYKFDNVNIGAIRLINGVFQIRIRIIFSNTIKEIVFLHELLHAKQILSGIPFFNYETDDKYKQFGKYYNEIQDIILDSSIHHQLFDWGYEDIKMITTLDFNIIYEHFCKEDITPKLIGDGIYLLRAAALYFSHSIEAYEAIVQLILKKDEILYNKIVELKQILDVFLNENSSLIDCINKIFRIVVNVA